MTKMKMTCDSERALFLIRDAMSDDEIDYIISNEYHISSQTVASSPTPPLNWEKMNALHRSQLLFTAFTHADRWRDTLMATSLVFPIQ